MPLIRKLRRAYPLKFETETKNFNSKYDREDPDQ